jgi:hypothetical protein
MTTRQHRTAFVASFVVLTLMLTSAASAYVLLSPARRWFPTPHAITVDSTGVASVTDSTKGVSATIAGINWWNGGGVNIANPSSGSVAYVLGDGRSDLIFSDPRRICTGTCLAATTIGYYDSGSTGVCTYSGGGSRTLAEITDSDVAFNLSYDYTTPGEPDGCSQEIYIDSVASHEFGHVIGLGHSSSSSALMYASVAYCSHKVVASDDVAGRDQLYNCSSWSEGGGGGGCTLLPAGSSCTSNSQCCSNSCKGKPGAKTCK